MGVVKKQPIQFLYIIHHIKTFFKTNQFIKAGG